MSNPNPSVVCRANYETSAAVELVLQELERIGTLIANVYQLPACR
jgi:hypothetical protein